MLFNLFNSHYISISFSGFSVFQTFHQFHRKTSNPKTSKPQKTKNEKPQNLKIFHYYFSTVGNLSFFAFLYFFSFFSSHLAPLAKLFFKNLKNGILTDATTFLLKKSSSFYLWMNCNYLLLSSPLLSSPAKGDHTQRIFPL